MVKKANVANRCPKREYLAAGRSRLEPVVLCSAPCGHIHRRLSAIPMEPVSHRCKPTIYYCPVESSPIPYDEFDTPVVHPQGTPCATGWRGVHIPSNTLPSAVSHRDRWHDALRHALRGNGRSALTSREREQSCKFWERATRQFLSPRQQESMPLCESIIDSGYWLLAYLMANTPPTPTGLWLEFGVFQGTSLNMTSDARAMLVADTMLGKGGRARDHGQGTARNGAEHRMRRGLASFTTHGFDSFEGLPTYWKFMRRGANVPQHARHTARAKSAGTGHPTRSASPQREIMVKAGTFSLGGMQPPVRLNALLHKGLFHETLPQFLSASPPEERVSWVNLDMDLYQG